MLLLVKPHVVSYNIYRYQHWHDGKEWGKQLTGDSNICKFTHESFDLYSHIQTAAAEILSHFKPFLVFNHTCKEYLHIRKVWVMQTLLNSLSASWQLDEGQALLVREEVVFMRLTWWMYRVFSHPKEHKWGNVYFGKMGIHFPLTDCKYEGRLIYN